MFDRFCGSMWILFAGKMIKKGCFGVEGGRPLTSEGMYYVSFDLTVASITQLYEVKEFTKWQKHWVVTYYTWVSSSTSTTTVTNSNFCFTFSRCSDVQCSSRMNKNWAFVLESMLKRPPSLDKIIRFKEGGESLCWTNTHFTAHMIHVTVNWGLTKSAPDSVSLRFLWAQPVVSDAVTFSLKRHDAELPRQDTWLKSLCFRWSVQV